MVVETEECPSSCLVSSTVPPPGRFSEGQSAAPRFLSYCLESDGWRFRAIRDEVEGGSRPPARGPDTRPPNGRPQVLVLLAFFCSFVHRRPRMVPGLAAAAVKGVKHRGLSGDNVFLVTPHGGITPHRIVKSISISFFSIPQACSAVPRGTGHGGTNGANWK